MSSGIATHRDNILRIHADDENMNLGVLASSRGTNLQAIIDACESGDLEARVALVISNNSKAEALARAQNAGISTKHVSTRTHPDPDHAIFRALKSHQVDLVVTAGYMKKLGQQTLIAFKERIINVHPSLLPRHGGKGMFGIHVHEAVIAAGDTETGATVHYVDGNYDTGDIIQQVRVLVEPTDTAESLAARVLPIEHELLITTLQELITKQCKQETEMPVPL